APDLISGQHHGHPLGQQQSGDQVALLPDPQLADGGIVRGALDTAVPRPVVIAAVPAVFTIRLVVLLVVADQVLRGEACMGGGEVDAGVRFAPARLVKVGGPREAAGKISDDPAISLPISAHRVPILVIPLIPARREIASLVAAAADVPRLRDELDL